MANAAVDGNRYIVTGIRFEGENQRHACSIDLDDFSGKPFYQALVAEFIEPPIPIIYRAVIVDGQRVGVYEIGDCQDKPYMMRVDYSEQLRRGDAYVRADDAVIKIGRRILFNMFDDRAKSVAPDDNVEIGFAGEVIQKKLYLPTVDLNQLPSAIEHGKLNQLVDVREKARDSGSTTTMARMVHMRLFGSDEPYEDRSPTTLLAEMEQIRQKHESDDHHFLLKKMRNGCSWLSSTRETRQFRTPRSRCLCRTMMHFISQRASLHSETPSSSPTIRPCQPKARK